LGLGYLSSVKIRALYGLLTIKNILAGRYMVMIRLRIRNFILILLNVMPESQGRLAEVVAGILIAKVLG